jgi:hypothetical protein
MTRGTCLRITRTMRTLQHVAYNRDMRTEKSDVPIDVRMYAFHRFSETFVTRTHARTDFRENTSNAYNPYMY